MSLMSSYPIIISYSLPIPYSFPPATIQPLRFPSLVAEFSDTLYFLSSVSLNIPPQPGFPPIIPPKLLRISAAINPVPSSSVLSCLDLLNTIIHWFPSILLGCSFCPSEVNAGDPLGLRPPFSFFLDYLPLFP